MSQDDCLSCFIIRYLDLQDDFIDAVVGKTNDVTDRLLVACYDFYDYTKRKLIHVLAISDRTIAIQAHAAFLMFSNRIFCSLVAIW